MSKPNVIVFALAVAAVAGASTPSAAQSAPAPVQTAASRGCESSGAPSLGQLFGSTVRDFKRLPSRQAASWLAAGAAAALAAHQADSDVSHELAEVPSLRRTFRPGAFIGGTPFELGTAFTTYAIGRALGKPRVACVAADLVQAQLMAEVLTTGLKQAARRSRPEGTGYSFPSGHTTVSFASVTVLQRHFGWKVGLPAYAVATYVATSRVEMKRHYLSDVAFGAALGIVAGRTIPIGAGRGLAIAPLAAPGGAGAAFTFVKK